MNNIKLLFLPLLLTLFLFSCQDKMTKYDRPAWLAGKVYTVILDHPDTLSTFATCVKLIGYDKILDVSGSYTVFAPSNEAFDSYFEANSKYNSVEDIPLPELERIVKYHVVQNPWSKAQLRLLDDDGWIDTTASEHNIPYAFKRQTILLDENIKYGVSDIGIGGVVEEIIVDTLQSDIHRIVPADSRKYAPIFFSEYFSINELNSNDYEFYFDRPMEGGENLYFAGAKVLSEELIAENGFVYIVDKVIEPLKNASQILSNKEGSNKYTSFLNLLNYFPSFRYNEEKTYLQPGADIGMLVDDLYDLTFPSLTFNFNNEKTSTLGKDGTVRYHRGLMAPTNEAFQQFIDKYLKIDDGWNSIKEAPFVIRYLIANSHMSINAIYPSDFESGFYNGAGDFITLDEANIVQKEFGSNSTFIGLKEAIVPGSFSSVSGPVFLKKGYQKVMFALYSTGLLNALNRPTENYMFFVESDINTSIDSSLIQSPYSLTRFAAFQLSEDGELPTGYVLSTSDLRTFLMNHIAKGHPDGLARKEFIPNLAGNYIIKNNITGEFSGTGNTTIGFRGSELAPELSPKELINDVPPNNGKTYEIKNWFSFNNASLYSVLSKQIKFQALLKKAGLVNESYQTYDRVVSKNDFYTVFVPTDEALDEAGADAMTIEELTSFLRLHFIQSDMIFTDGKKSPQYYETARIDYEKSTEFTTVFTQLYIKPGYDIITIQDKNEASYVDVVENGDSTNIITGVTVASETEQVFPTMYSNGVVHVINKALIIEELDTK